MNSIHVQAGLRWSTASASTSLAILLAGAGGALATSYVPMSDAALADGAPVVIEGRVLGAEAAPDEAAISYLVEVERVLAGDVPGGTIALRVPGGPAPGGGWFRVSGAPVFATGERALLMLEPRRDGAYAVSQLALGVFHRLTFGGRQILVRDLTEVELLDGPAGASDRRRAARSGAAGSSRPVVERPRDADAFADWIAARAGGDATAPASYFADLPEGAVDRLESVLRARRDATALPSRAGSAATLLLAGDGLPVRWFDFDTGATIEVNSHRVVQQGWSDGVAQLQRALDAWNSLPEARVAVALGDATSADAGLSAPDGVNTVLWNDPFDEIAGSYSCTDGGILAIGGNWYREDVEMHGGQRFHRIVEGDVVLQDGAACYLTRSGGDDGAELLAHELGHVLGLGHACGEGGVPSCTEARYRSSLMRPMLRGWGRGPALGEDDALGLLALYAEPAQTGGLGVFVPEGDFVLLAQDGLPFTLAYGLPGDQPLAGDWDADGGDTIGVYRGGRFLLHAPDTLSDVAVSFGGPGDAPVTGDWDGDGVDTIGAFRDGVFRLRNSNTAGPADLVVAVGAAGDLPIAGDWDGDGRDTVGVFQASTGRFVLLESLASGAATAVIELGGQGDSPVAGDWDGDGVDSVGVFRDGVFTLLGNDPGAPRLTTSLPAASGVPVAGRWERMR